MNLSIMRDTGIIRSTSLHPLTSNIDVILSENRFIPMIKQVYPDRSVLIQDDNALIHDALGKKNDCGPIDFNQRPSEDVQPISHHHHRTKFLLAESWSIPTEELL